MPVDIHELEIAPRVHADANGCRVTWASDFAAYLTVRLTPDELQAVAECFLASLVRELFHAALRADELAQRAAAYDGLPARFTSSHRVGG